MESLASFWLTRFLTFNATWVASHEAFSTECSLVFRIDFDQSASDSEAKSFSLALVAATTEVNIDIILLSYFKLVKWLLNDELKD